MSGEEYRVVLAPALASLAVTLFYLAVLLARQGHLPIAEAASYFVLATCIYTIIPLLQFVMSGLQCPIHGDYRLFSWAPTPHEFGGFAWRHVLLLASFVITYLPIRGTGLVRTREFKRPVASMLIVIVALILLVNAYFFGLSAYVGPVLSVYEGGTGAEYLQLPHLIAQISNVLQIGLLTLKQSLIVLLLTRWRQRKWRITLFCWLLLEIILTVWTLESRAATVIMLLTLIAAYHHLVRPIRTATAFAAGGLLLGAFILFGLVRDVGTDRLKMNWQRAWESPTEFQILYGNAYDIHMRKKTHTLPPVPPEMYFSDLYRLVPSQLLPFEKVDPAEWYRGLLGYGKSGMGFMFGIVAQSVIGHDWIELALRGMLLAVFYALAHRAWLRHSGSFWGTVAYMFILAWAYYAFRASSFEILYRLVYYLAPTVIVVTVLTTILAAPLRRRDPRPAQPT